MAIYRYVKPDYMFAFFWGWIASGFAGLAWLFLAERNFFLAWIFGAPFFPFAYMALEDAGLLNWYWYWRRKEAHD